MKNILIKIMIVASILLAGCSNQNSQSENTTLGAVTGAVVGGLAGSLIGGGTGKAVAIGVGIVGGALVGGYMGKNMDSSDHTMMNGAMDHNAMNQNTTWTNPNTGAKYSIVPTSKVISYHGYNYCRHYQTTMWVSGKSKQVYGVACRQSDGSWLVVK